MKKALIVLLAVAMIFAFGATAMAASYTDMDAQSAAGKDAVNFMSALDIIAGYPDGTYGPERNITRAEFAKIAVNAAGLADSAEYLNSTASKFSDVKVGVWYTGFVNLAQSQGYIQGYPDGTFRPNATITNQEVVTVLLRMLGYTDNLTGPWPVDYINQAVKSGILDDVKFVGAVPAKRVDVAIMAKETLNQNLVVWTKDKDTFENKVVGQEIVDLPTTPPSSVTVDKYVTLLVDSFGDGTVAANKVVAGFGQHATAPTLNLGNAFAYNKDDAKLTLNVTVGGPYEIKADTIISDGMTFDQLAKHQVNLVLKNAGKKDQYVAYIDVTSYVKEFDKVTEDLATNGKVGLDKKNHTPAAGTVANDFSKLANTPNVKVYAFFNDDDELYAVVADKNITAGTTNVVKEEATSKGKVNFFSGSMTVADDAKAMIIKDGKQIKVADLKKYDVVAKYNELYLASALNSAKLERVYTDNSVMFNGIKYAPTGSIAVVDADDEDVLTNLADYAGEEVKYLLDATNKVAFILVGEAKTSSVIEGIVVDYKAESGAYSTGGLETISVFNAEGKTVDYKVDGKYTLATGTPTTMTNFAGNASVTAIHVGSYVKFTVDADGKIKTVKKTAGDTVIKDLSSATKVETNDKTNRITVTGTGAAVYNVPTNVVVFNLGVDTKGKLTVEVMERADIISGNELEGTADSLSLEAGTVTMSLAELTLIVDGVSVKTVVVTDANAVSDAKYGIIEDEGWTNSDGDDIVKFYGDNTEYILDAAGDAAVKDVFYSYTLSGDTVTLTEVAGIASNKYEDATVAIKSVKNGLVTLNSAVNSKTQGEFTEDSVVLNIVLDENDAVDEINIWDENDVDVNANEFVLWSVNSDNEIEYILIIEIQP